MHDMRRREEHIYLWRCGARGSHKPSTITLFTTGMGGANRPGSARSWAIQPCGSIRDLPLRLHAGSYTAFIVVRLWKTKSALFLQSTTTSTNSARKIVWGSCWFTSLGVATVCSLIES